MPQHENIESHQPASGIKPCLIKHPEYSMLSPFGHPFIDSWSDVPSLQNFPTVEEIAMLNLSWKIRKLEEWWKKYKDPEYVVVWKHEAQLVMQEDIFVDSPGEKRGYEESSPALLELDDRIIPIRRRQRIQARMPLRECLFQYVMDELECHKETYYHTNGQFHNGPYIGIVYGDRVVSENLKNEFIQASRKLENALEKEKYRRQGSGEHVLDLVNPSLYPLQYGVTPVVADMENDHVGLNIFYQGKTIPMYRYNAKDHSIKSLVDSFGIDTNYQWLPSLFEVSKDGSEVVIKSYINNLHPVYHENLYKPIADIFKQFIPAINVALTQYATGQRLRIDYTDIESLSCSSNQHGYSENSSEYHFNNTLHKTCWPLLLEPVYKPIPEEDVCTIDVMGTTLKVIVKMTNIELTPENPNYLGEPWHAQGAINEDIVCTCVYYYDCENITYSELQFRAGFKDPEYSHCTPGGISKVFGIDEEDELVFSCGSIETKKDRMVVFPNMYQHHVAPFELKDKTKPGHRKILCFFVCDPYNDNIVSTDQVPPQQAQWWAEQKFSVDSEQNPTMSNKFSTEPTHTDLQTTEWPMSFCKAKQIEEKLMEGRDPVITEDDCDNAYQRSFSHYED